MIELYSNFDSKVLNILRSNLNTPSITRFQVIVFFSVMMGLFLMIASPLATPMTMSFMLLLAAASEMDTPYKMSLRDAPYKIFAAGNGSLIFHPAGSQCLIEMAKMISPPVATPTVCDHLLPSSLDVQSLDLQSGDSEAARWSSAVESFEKRSVEFHNNPNNCERAGRKMKVLFLGTNKYDKLSDEQKALHYFEKSGCDILNSYHNMKFLRIALYEPDSNKRNSKSNSKSMGTENVAEFHTEFEEFQKVRDEFILGADIIILGSGNSTYSIQKWIRLGIADAIWKRMMNLDSKKDPKKKRNPVVLAGGSAGADTMFQWRMGPAAPPDDFLIQKVFLEKKAVLEKLIKPDLAWIDKYYFYRGLGSESQMGSESHLGSESHVGSESLQTKGETQKTKGREMTTGYQKDYMWDRNVGGYMWDHNPMAIAVLPAVVSPHLDSRYNEIDGSRGEKKTRELGLAQILVELAALTDENAILNARKATTRNEGGVHSLTVSHAENAAARNADRFQKAGCHFKNDASPPVGQRSVTPPVGQNSDASAPHGGVTSPSNPSNPQNLSSSDPEQTLSNSNPQNIPNSDQNLRRRGLGIDNDAAIIYIGHDIAPFYVPRKDEPFYMPSVKVFSVKNKDQQNIDPHSQNIDHTIDQKSSTSSHAQNKTHATSIQNKTPPTSTQSKTVFNKFTSNKDHTSAASNKDHTWTSASNKDHHTSAAFSKVFVNSDHHTSAAFDKVNDVNEKNGHTMADKTTADKNQIAPDSKKIYTDGGGKNWDPTTMPYIVEVLKLQVGQSQDISILDAEVVIPDSVTPIGVVQEQTTSTGQERTNEDAKPSQLSSSQQPSFSSESREPPQSSLLFSSEPRDPPQSSLLFSRLEPREPPPQSSFSGLETREENGCENSFSGVVEKTRQEDRSESKTTDPRANWTLENNRPITLESMEEVAVVLQGIHMADRLYPEELLEIKKTAVENAILVAAYASGDNSRGESLSAEVVVTDNTQVGSGALSTVANDYTQVGSGEIAEAGTVEGETPLPSGGKSEVNPYQHSESLLFGTGRKESPPLGRDDAKKVPAEKETPSAAREGPSAAKETPSDARESPSTAGGDVTYEIAKKARTDDKAGTDDKETAIQAVKDMFAILGKHLIGYPVPHSGKNGEQLTMAQVILHREYENHSKNDTATESANVVVNVSGVATTGGSAESTVIGKEKTSETAVGREKAIPESR